MLLKTVSEQLSGFFLPAVLFVSGIYFLFKIGRYVLSPVFIFRSVFGFGKKTDEKSEERAGVSDTEVPHDLKKGSRQDLKKAVTASERRSRGCSGKNGRSFSPFSSLCLALAGTLGVGNISGVAAAIAVGGAGAVFWIWVSAIVSSVLKYAETVLAMQYRKRGEDGCYHGGAHLYIKNGLNMPRVAVLFSVMCIFTSFTMGCITQTKAAADGVFTAVKIPPAFVGAIFFILVLLLSFGGGKKISAFTLKLIPPLCLLYVFFSVLVIFIFRQNIPFVTSAIFSEAFNFRAGASGVFGFLFTPAMRCGVIRGIMSNEAGCGTAPMAHASAETDSPVRQGALGIVEVLCDTLILCTLTAYVVLLSGASLSVGATEAAVNAFSYALGEPVKLFLGGAIFLFALGSVAGWAFYGQESVKALGLGKKTLRVYAVLFAASAFLGCVMPENTAWELADLSVSVMGVINMSAVLLLSGTVIRLTKEYFKKKEPL